MFITIIKIDWNSFSMQYGLKQITNFQKTKIKNKTNWKKKKIMKTWHLLECVSAFGMLPNIATKNEKSILLFSKSS